ncbi:kinase [Bacillus phage G]|uniref:Gp139 n=1 Tax=Bacillus phage G TaxID=2884420 RepID=G3MBK5_9CAUD|nr:kinase [Bacillus phage G]AEO93401.1 gp139 [Bacillus phage G]
MKKIYFFKDGHKDMHNYLGKKGANLCEMYNMDLPVPNGFIIPTYLNRETKELRREIENAIEKLGGRLGEDLFVSVRSSAPTSMPGMMDSFLNISNYDDLFNSIELVVNSWNNKRAVTYRENNGISEGVGTAIVIQKMIFGNKDENSGSGVVFSRNPNNGEEGLVGEILFNSFGEELVLGKKTPLSITILKEKMPNVYTLLENISKKLETHFSSMQEIEFTIEEKELYVLQTREVKKKNKIVKFKIKEKQKNPITIGIASSYGAATGLVVFDSKKAVELKSKGKNVILVRLETSPDDIEGIIACDGIVTLQGGATSHAAVVARSMNKPCICGCQYLDVNELEWITIEGQTGKVFLGEYDLEIDDSL